MYKESGGERKSFGKANTTPKALVWKRVNAKWATRAFDWIPTGNGWLQNALYRGKLNNGYSVFRIRAIALDQVDYHTWYPSLELILDSGCISAEIKAHVYRIKTQCKQPRIEYQYKQITSAILALLTAVNITIAMQKTFDDDSYKCLIWYKSISDYFQSNICCQSHVSSPTILIYKIGGAVNTGNFFHISETI